MNSFFSITPILLCLFLAANTEAVVPYTPQMPDPVLEPWRWQSYPKLKGLGLQCLIQDRQGNMWFGVDGAVLKYNGLEWTEYNSTHGLMGTQINALCATKDGNLYAATEQGINQFSNGSWHHIFPSETHSWQTWTIKEISDGSLWAGTQWGAVHLQKKQTTLYTAPDDTVSAKILLSNTDVQIVVVPNEALPQWPWPPGIGITRLPNQETSIITNVAPNGPAETAGLQVGDKILSLNDQINEGRSITLSVIPKGRQDTTTLTINKQRLESTYRYFWVYDIYEDQDKSIWFGNYRGELIRHHPQNEWTKFDRKNGIDQGYMPRLCETEEGLWAVYGDNSKSINLYKDDTWQATEIEELGYGHHYTSIIKGHDGTLWIGGSRLIARQNGDWRVYNFEEMPIPSHRMRLTQTLDGALWVAGEGQEAARLDLSTSNWTTYEGLYFQCETPDNAQWFIDENGVVKFDGENWTKHTVEDGLLDSPGQLLVTQDGILWAAGSHNNTAATAKFEGGKWTRDIHPHLGWDIDPRTMFEAKDSSLWLSTFVDWWHYKDRPFLGGMIQYTKQGWQHHHTRPIPLYAYGIGQTPDGLLWFGGRLVQFDGHIWQPVREPTELGKDYIDVIHTGFTGNLWLGTRTYGVFQKENGQWNRYDYRHGLADNKITSILQSQDQTVWVGTLEGISRFDGHTWTTHALPQTLPRPKHAGSIRQSQDGAIWLNTVSNSKAWLRRAEPIGKKIKKDIFALKTIRYKPETDHPETIITESPDEVSQPGNVTLTWKGTDPWQNTRSEHLKYAWKLDDEEWSPYAKSIIHTFKNLPSGKHTFQVKARDNAFNVDLTPALVQFSVLPPIWQQPWFVILIVSFVGITAYQASRIIIRDQKLKQTNEALSSANKELYGVNVELQQTIDERARLDDQLQNLQYLFQLRTELDTKKSPRSIILCAGDTMMHVLTGIEHAGVAVTFDSREWTFGQAFQNDVKTYTRPLSVSGKERGTLKLHCGMELTEGQERALLDETAGQLSRTLEARELEMQLLQSARLVSLGQMAAGVAHELNQPLTVIETTAGDICLRLMDNIPIDTDELKTMMENVRGVVDRMAGTVDHLRVFSRDISDDPRQSVNINDVITNSLTMIETQLENHGIKLTCNLTKNLPTVWGHPHPLEQIFLNLLANARDAIDDQTEMTEKKEIHLKTYTQNDCVIAEVSDNGIGMDNATQLRLFEPFFTTKNADRGTGLGLSIVYAIIRNHEGQIECKSTPHKGTTFIVSLPISEETNTHA